MTIIQKIIHPGYLSALVITGLLISAIAYAADEASVTATVTVQNIAVSVSDGTVAYGILGQNATESTVALDDTQTATNNGNVAVNLNIQGQHSGGGKGSGGWNLASAAGEDEYVHRFCTADCGSPPTNFTALTIGYQTLANGITASGTQNFDLQINTPNPSTVFTQQSVDVRVQATEAS